jgi:hypothetical protein
MLGVVWSGSERLGRVLRGKAVLGRARRGYLRNGLRWFDSIGAGCGLAGHGWAVRGTALQGEDTYGWSHRRFDSADVGCGDARRGSARQGTVWRGKVIHAKASRRFDSFGVNCRHRVARYGLARRCGARYGWARIPTQQRRRRCNSVGVGHGNAWCGAVRSGEPRRCGAMLGRARSLT